MINGQSVITAFRYVTRFEKTYLPLRWLIFTGPVTFIITRPTDNWVVFYIHNHPHAHIYTLGLQQISLLAFRYLDILTNTELFANINCILKFSIATDCHI